MSSEARLGELLDALDIESVRVLTPGADLDVVVSTVVVADIEALETTPTQALALLPGLPDHPAAATAAIERASAAGASSIAIRPGRWSKLDPGRAELPVIGIPDALEWGVLYEMLSGVLASSGETAINAPGEQPLARLFAFADAVAVALGGAVMIEDPQAQMLAYSNIGDQPIDEVREEAILSRRVPLTERNRADYLELSRATGPMRFDGLGDELPRLATAVRAGDQILGFLWIIDDRQSLADDALEQITGASRMAAIELARARAIDDVGRRTRDDALRRLLDGEDDRALLTAAGIESGLAAGVMAARTLGGDSSRSGSPSAWTADSLALSARVRFPEARCVTVDDIVYIAVGTAREDPDELASIARMIIDRLSSHRQELQIAVGTAPRVEELGAARSEADRVLAALAMRGPGRGVATISAVRSLAVIAELAELAAEHPTLLAGPIGSILDPAHDSPEWMLGTLRAYFANSGNLKAAAAELQIHANTLRYRLDRISDVSGIDLDDPDERLVLALQIRLLPPE